MAPFESAKQAKVYRYRTMQTERLEKLAKQHEENAAIIKEVLKEREQEHRQR